MPQLCLFQVRTQKEDSDISLLIRHPSGKQEASTNIIEGQPVVFSAQVIDTSDSKRYAEIARRSINVTPNTDTDKISEAIKLMGNQAGLLPEEYDEQVVSRDDQQRAAHDS